MHGNYIIADTHFNHKKIIAATGRPYMSVVDMNCAFIENWNNTVKNTDTIYILGDFAFANKSMITELVSRLNGKKVLILGNHDVRINKHEKFWYECGFDKVSEYSIIFKNHFVLCHKPIKNHGNFWVFHGHIHDNLIEDEHYINVSVEHTDYRPVNLDRLISKVWKSDTWISEIRNGGK